VEAAMMPKACPVPQRSTLVADIDAANRLLNRTACHHGDDRKLLRLLNEQLHDLQHKAAIAFAEDNGWKLAKSAFGVSKLGSFGPDYGCYGSTEIFDHCLHFRSHGQNVAIVAQPYSKTLLSIFDFKNAVVHLRRKADGPINGAGVPRPAAAVVQFLVSAMDVVSRFHQAGPTRHLAARADDRNS
jgi:hypothetical protein